MSGAGHALSLEGVTKRYGTFVAVDDVSLGVERGEFLTLLGPSGSGKTTILMMIAGFTQPSGGVVIDAGAAVRGSVLMPGAHVGADAVVERAILGPRAVVGAGARVDDLAVLGEGATVGAGLRMSGGSLTVGEHLEIEPDAEES